MPRRDPRRGYFASFKDEGRRPATPGVTAITCTDEIFGTRKVAEHLGAGLALDALEMAIWSRGGVDGGLVHHSDGGVQYTSIRYAERLDQIGAACSVGSKGDSFDNAAAESLNSLYKKELIDFRGGWEDVIDVTIATMEWVAWYNTERLHSYCGNVPPRECEEAFYRSRGTEPMPAENQAV